MTTKLSPLCLSLITRHHNQLLLGWCFLIQQVAVVRRMFGKAWRYIETAARGGRGCCVVIILVKVAMMHSKRLWQCCHLAKIHPTLYSAPSLLMGSGFVQFAQFHFYWVQLRSYVWSIPRLSPSIPVFRRRSERTRFQVWSWGIQLDHEGLY